MRDFLYCASVREAGKSDSNFAFVGIFVKFVSHGLRHTTHPFESSQLDVWIWRLSKSRTRFSPTLLPAWLYWETEISNLKMHVAFSVVSWLTRPPFDARDPGLRSTNTVGFTTYVVEETVPVALCYLLITLVSPTWTYRLAQWNSFVWTGDQKNSKQLHNNEKLSRIMSRVKFWNSNDADPGLE